MIRFSLLVAILLASCCCASRAADKEDFVPPKLKNPALHMAWLKSWLQIKRLNERDNKPNDYVEEELAKSPELPYIRTRARALFKTDAFTDNTVEQLSDWLCVTFDLDVKKVSMMPLEEVSARLKFKEKNQK